MRAMADEDRDDRSAADVVPLVSGDEQLMTVSPDVSGRAARKPLTPLACVTVAGGDL
jgi:hypothetical protein